MQQNQHHFRIKNSRANIYFLPFKATNDIAKPVNNNLNQLQTKAGTTKQGHMKRYNHVKSYA
jgi:hypothetical protein